MRLGLLLASALLATGGSVGFAAVPGPTVVVSPNGSDAADGSVAHPLATVDAAIARLPEGGTVLLRGGGYHQRVLADGVHDVTIEPYRHEHAVLSGAGLTPTAGMTAMVEVRDSDGVTVRGLDVTGYRTTSLKSVPVGILVTGHDRGVRITGDHVHDLGNDNGTLGSFDINAHGIAVYGDDAQRSITGLVIDHNTVDHLKLGASESVVVNGNVEHWSITRNRVVSNDNIGIDAIGFESTIGGTARYTEANRARDGVIAHNLVRGIVSHGNPAYWEDGTWCDCADGIYVDGGTRIRITGNTVDLDDIGIEVAAENRHGDASHVRVDHNRITRSLFTGLTTGGYCDGRNDCGGVDTGASFDDRFDHNVLTGNNRKNDGSPEILIQYNAHDLAFEHNRVTDERRPRAARHRAAGGRRREHQRSQRVRGRQRRGRVVRLARAHLHRVRRLPEGDRAGRALRLPLSAPPHRHGAFEQDIFPSAGHSGPIRPARVKSSCSSAHPSCWSGRRRGGRRRRGLSGRCAEMGACPVRT